MVEIEQLAKELGVSPSYVYKKIRENREALGLNVQKVKTSHGKKMKLTPEGVNFIVELLGAPTLEPIDQSEHLAKLQKQNGELLEALNIAKDKIITLQEQNLEFSLEASRVGLLEEKNYQQKKEYDELWESYEELREEYNEYFANSVEENTELYKQLEEANKELERMKSRSLWQRIRNK